MLLLRQESRIALQRANPDHPRTSIPASTADATAKRALRVTEHDPIQRDPGTPGGVHGHALVVDLDRASARREPIPAEWWPEVIGGAGLATRLLNTHCPPGADPLGPSNPLIFATSPFAGTAITTAAKIAVATRSPQTGMIGESLSSSYLAIALKQTGHDAFVITGNAAAWSVLVVDGPALRLEPADDLLGLSPDATADVLRFRLGHEFRVAAIGAAGEHLVRYAAISNDGRLAGRTGTGAVMGSKRLKAIAVRGNTLPPVAHPEELLAAAADLTGRSLGPATAKYREHGTAANLEKLAALGALPGRNFAAVDVSALTAITEEALRVDRRVDRHGCAACAIGCEHHYHLRDGSTARLEYEAQFALGSLCGIEDPETLLQASARCDALGLDAISLGGTIAWAMACGERGIEFSPFGGPAPRFGDGEAVRQLVDAIAHRRGLGDLLAEGSRAAAAVVGQGSDAFAMHVKGLEIPGYDPRRLPTMALGFAVAARGACQNRSSAYDVDLDGTLAPDARIAQRVAATIVGEDQASLMDSLTLCKFLRRCFADLPEEAATLHALVTGLPTTRDSLLAAGARINREKHAFNRANGWTRSLDTLPSDLSVPDLDRMVDAYHLVRSGAPTGV